MNIDFKLPEEVGAIYTPQKNTSKVSIRGIGEVDFTTISLKTAQKIVEKTADKYLAEKAKTTVNTSVSKETKI